MTSSEMSTAFYYRNRYLMAFECRATVAFQSNSPSRYSTASADTILCQGHYAEFKIEQYHQSVFVGTSW